MRYILAIIFIVLLVSCKKHRQQTNEIVKVELARSGAWSDFGATISIDSSLTYQYFGELGTTKQGYFSGKIKPAFWDTLNQKFSLTNYKKFHVNDSMQVADLNYFELIIHWKGGKNRILKMENNTSKHDSLLNVIMWIDNSYRGVQLHKVKYPFVFETTFHQEPPKPKLRQVFPPPVIDRN
jgi:hypothetical protein